MAISIPNVDIAKLQEQAARAAREREGRVAREAERRQQTVSRQTRAHQLAVARGVSADQQAAADDFYAYSGAGEAEAWAGAIQASQHNLDLLQASSDAALENTLKVAKGLQAHVDESFFGTIDKLYGGTGWRTDILGAAAGSVKDASALAARFKDVMPEILSKAEKFVSTSMDNIQSMAEGRLSKGTMDLLNRTAGETMTQLGSAGQAALFSRAKMIGQTAEQAQAQAVELMPKALGSLQQAYADAASILNNPAAAAASYTATMKQYMPGQLDPTGLYGAEFAARNAAGMIDPNNVYGGILKGRQQIAALTLRERGDIRAEGRRNEQRTWETYVNADQDTWKFGQANASEQYFNALQAGIQMAGDRARHEYDMAGMRLAAQTAQNEFTLGQEANRLQKLGMLGDMFGGPGGFLRPPQSPQYFNLHGFGIDENGVRDTNEGIHNQYLSAVAAWKARARDVMEMYSQL